MKTVRKKGWKAGLAAAGCVLGSLLLFCILTLTDTSESPVSEVGKIARARHGGDENGYELLVEGLEDVPVWLHVTVGAQTYTEEQALEVFAQIMSEMEVRIKGDNPSLQEVSQSLELPTWIDEYGVRLRWYSSDSEIMDNNGTLQEQVLIVPETKFFLGVQLSDGTYRQDYELPISVSAPFQTEMERTKAALMQEIKRREEGQRTEPHLSLPIIYEGKELRYRTKKDSNNAILLVLGVLLAGLCYAKAYTDVREKEKQRERELLLDYAELLSKLTIFIGAGLSVGGAWERMVQDYEAAVKQGRQKRRTAYEEMGQTYHQIQSGISEGEAFRNFGKRCRLQPYLKLSSLLEQNRKTGMKRLREILQSEMTDAFEQRKNLARRLGEEAGTKLLLPLFLMLGIVMVMIMVPAMMTMG